MRNLLLLRISKFNKDQFSRFCDYTCSPYFNKSERITEIIEILRDNYPDISEEVLKKIAKRFPSASAVNVQLSRMNDLLDDFELQQLIESKQYILQALKYELELDKKNNVKYYIALQTSERRDFRSSDDLWAEYYKEFSSIALCENNWLNEKQKIIEHSENSMRAIMDYFLSKYLMIYANKSTHTLGVTNLKDSASSRLVLDYVKSNLDQQSLSVKCLFYIIQLFQSIYKNDELFDKNYESLKNDTFNLLNENISYEINYALVQAVSACVYKGVMQTDYIAKAFEMVDFLISRKLFFTFFHEQQTQQRFILLIKIALGCGQTDWALNFINTQIWRVDKKSQASISNYATGLVYFNLKEYEKATKLMLKVNLSGSSQFTIDNKLTLLKMYYEVNELHSFQYQTNSLMKYIKQAKVSKNYQLNVMHSIAIITLFFKCRTSNDIKKMHTEIDKKKLNYLIQNYRDKWYVEKYDLLLNANPTINQ